MTIRYDPWSFSLRSWADAADRIGATTFQIKVEDARELADRIDALRSDKATDWMLLFGENAGRNYASQVERTEKAERQLDHWRTVATDAFALVESLRQLIVAKETL